MYPSRLVVTFAVLLISVTVSRAVLASLGPTGDVLATLFVPPDRKLPWPHGVQESDEPWGWDPAAAATTDPPDRAECDGDGDGPGGPTDGAGDLVEASAARPSSGPFVVPVRRVEIARRPRRR